jgi:hypothetical protein
MSLGIPISARAVIEEPDQKLHISTTDCGTKGPSGDSLFLLNSTQFFTGSEPARLSQLRFEERSWMKN